MSEVIPGGPYLTTCGLIANAYHDELGRGGYFHKNSGTSEGQLIFIYGCYLAYEQLRGSNNRDELDAADVYLTLAEQMLDAMGDGSLKGAMLRQPIPETPDVITLIHWLFAAKGDVTLQEVSLDFQASSTGGVLTVPASANGGSVFRVWQIYPADKALLYANPFSPVVGGGGVQLDESNWQTVGGQTRITLPAGVPAGTYKIVYGYAGVATIPRGSAYEAYPNWTAVADGYSACAPDTFRWFEQAIAKAIEHDTRPGNALKWAKLRNAMRQTALRGQDLSDLREIFKPQAGIRVSKIDGFYCYGSRTDSKPPPAPLDQGWKGFAYWSRDNATGDIVGKIPFSVSGEAQLGRGFEDGWRVATSYQDADHFLYLQLGVNVHQSNGIRVYVSSTREYVPSQRWYCDVTLLPGFAADGVVREYLIPRSLLVNEEGLGTALPAGTMLLNFGITSTIQAAHELRLRRMRFVGGPSAAWVQANLAEAVAGAKMPYFPGAMPFAINADTVAQQFVGYNGNPFHGYQLPDFWLDCAEAAEVVFPSLTVADLPIPDAGGALTYPIAPTVGGVAKPKNILLMEQQLRFLTDAQAKYAADRGFTGPYAHTYVLNTPARANIGNPAPATWVYTNDDPNTRWVGYQVRIVESLAVLAFRTSGVAAATDARAAAITSATAWLNWLNGAWPNLSGGPYRGMPTDFDAGGAPTTLYEEPHAAAIVLRACMYLRRAGVDAALDAVCAALIIRCWNYMELNWRTTGPMAFTWSPVPAESLWYGFWHGEIIATIAVMLEAPSLVPVAIPAALPRLRLTQTSKWIVGTGTYFCDATLPPNLPVFGHRADWEGGVVETLEWLTDVLPSKTGSEQRRALRSSPRRMYEATIVAKGADRTRFDLSVRAAGSNVWLAPIWPDVLTLKEAGRIGTLRLACDTVWRDFVEGGLVLIMRADGAHAALRLTKVEPGVLHLARPLDATWAAGSRVTPLRPSRFTEQPKVTARAADLMTAQVRFKVVEANDFAGPASPVDALTYRGYPVLTQRPDESEDLSYGFERMVQELDNETGVPSITDTAAKGFGTQTYRWLLHGRAQHAALRATLYRLEGRLKAIWLPSFAADLQLTQTAAPSSTSIRVQACGYTAFGGAAQPGRRDIVLELRDGTLVMRRVVSSVEISDSVEQLTLDAPIGVAVSAAGVRQISFMALARLASDTIEFQHETDVEGTSSVAVNFRNTYETRSATPY